MNHVACSDSQVFFRALADASVPDLYTPGFDSLRGLPEFTGLCADIPAHCQYPVTIDNFKPDNHVSSKDRTVMIDDLALVCRYLDLEVGILFQAIYLLDLYTETKDVALNGFYRRDALTCLWMADKYQSVKPTSIHRYTTFFHPGENIAALEMHILNKIGWRLDVKGFHLFFPNPTFPLSPAFAMIREECLWWAMFYLASPFYYHRQFFPACCLYEIFYALALNDCSHLRGNGSMLIMADTLHRLERGQKTRENLKNLYILFRRSKVNKTH